MSFVQAIQIGPYPLLFGIQVNSRFRFPFSSSVLSRILNRYDSSTVNIGWNKCAILIIYDNRLIQILSGIL